MKFASLVFLLVPFVANAANLCVEDNTTKCRELGYTESSCPNGGVACQYNTSLWYCAKWTCADGRLYTAQNKPASAECVETAYKNLTCYDCTEQVGCAIGDVFYADGSCGNVENYDSSKVAVGVVYALSDTKGGIPYNTPKAESAKSKHGRVINLKFLTANSSTGLFDPENPYYNSDDEMYFGLYSTDISELTNYNSPTKLMLGFQNGDKELYNGKQNTAIIAKTQTAYDRCLDGNIKPNSNSYIHYCVPTAANAALAFYPPEVNSSHTIVGAGNWYLPAIGELVLLYGTDITQISTGGSGGALGTTRTLVNNTLTALANKGVDTDILNKRDNYTDVYSSNEYNSQHSWKLDLNNGARDYDNYHRGYGFTWERVSLEF